MSGEDVGMIVFGVTVSFLILSFVFLVTGGWDVWLQHRRRQLETKLKIEAEKTHQQQLRLKILEHPHD